MTLVKLNNDLFPAFSNLFEDFFGRDDEMTPTMNRWNRMPAVNIREDDNNYHLELAAPGLKKDDFKITLDNNLLTIETEMKDEKEVNKQNYSRKEFNYHAFRRSFTLPESADNEKIDAKYKDGVLNLMIPKKEESRVKPQRTIKIS